MAKLDTFDAFDDPTPPVAGAVAPEAPPEAPAVEVGTNATRDEVGGPQEALQARLGAAEESAPPDAAPVVAAVPLTRDELARWEHWLNATAGKLGKTLQQAQAAAQAWQNAVGSAQAAGVDDFPVMVAAMRALSDAPAELVTVVKSLGSSPQVQQAVMAALGEALANQGDSGTF